jgi:hypothetical protein
LFFTLNFAMRFPERSPSLEFPFNSSASDAAELSETEASEVDWLRLRPTIFAFKGFGEVAPSGRSTFFPFRTIGDFPEGEAGAGVAGGGGTVDLAFNVNATPEDFGAVSGIGFP